MPQPTFSKPITLPLDCRVDYYPDFMTPEESDELFNYLIANVDLSEQRLVTATGEEHVMETGKCMFVDDDNGKGRGLHESLGRRTAWPEPVMELRRRIEELTGRVFETCVCIYYRDGTRGVDFHTDLPAFGDTSVIPSVSLGAEREFILRNIRDHSDRFALKPPHGSLIVMGEGCQQLYEHAVLRDEAVTGARINLTFRMIGFDR